MLANQGADLAAHLQIQASYQAADGLAQLYAEYLTIARAAEADRWDALIASTGLTPEQARQATASEAYGPLIAALRDAQARGLNVDEALPRLIATRPLDDADDVAAVLHARVDTWVERAVSRHRPAGNLIAGLIPRAEHVTDDDLAHALQDREQAIEQRASALLDTAIEQDSSLLLRRLGRPPDDKRSRTDWLRQARVTAAYRDLSDVHSSEPLHARDIARSIEQTGHQKRAAAAARKALKLSQHARNRQLTYVPAADLNPSHDARRGPEL